MLTLEPLGTEMVGPPRARTGPAIERNRTTTLKAMKSRECLLNLCLEKASNSAVSLTIFVTLESCSQFLTKSIVCCLWCSLSQRRDLKTLVGMRRIILLPRINEFSCSQTGEFGQCAWHSAWGGTLLVHWPG